LIDNHDIVENTNIENISNISEISNFEEIPDANSITCEVYIGDKIINKEDITQNDIYIIEKLKKEISRYKEDIISYKEDIDNRILEKLDLINTLEAVNRENKNLLRHVNYLKNNTSWFYRIFS